MASSHRCSMLIPDTFMACGEGNQYCSGECLRLALKEEVVQAAKIFIASPLGAALNHSQARPEFKNLLAALAALERLKS